MDDHELESLLAPLQRLHDAIGAAVLRATSRHEIVELAGVADDSGGGDTIYRIDRISEEALLAFFEAEIAPRWPVVLVAEGLEGGQVTLPRGTPAANARYRVIVDPIDGTRGLMYQKRSAWILTGVAPNRGPGTHLGDVELALQTELPLAKQDRFDRLWALRGRGAWGERIDRESGARRPLDLRPSRARTLAHGFVTFVRFFPGGREELSAIDDEVTSAALGPVRHGKALCFEDQYISTGGQLYELCAGHDRFVADLRPLVDALLARRGSTLGISCHPYDLATELVARELGVVVTDPGGAPLRTPLDVTTEVAWVGYANEALRAAVEPLLAGALRRRGLLPPAATERRAPESPP